jgi:hypothetical protein
VVADVLILNEAGNTERRRVVPIFNQPPKRYIGQIMTTGHLYRWGFWGLFIGHTIEQLATNDTAGIARQDALRASASQVDNGTIFKAGSALFRVISVNYGGSNNGIEEGNLNAVLECIRTGKMPRANYGLTHWQQVGRKSMHCEQKLTPETGRFHPLNELVIQIKPF